jgi:hypothetical protein
MGSDAAGSGTGHRNKDGTEQVDQGTLAWGSSFQLAQCSSNVLGTNRPKSGIPKLLVEVKRWFVEEHDHRLSL